MHRLRRLPALTSLAGSLVVGALLAVSGARGAHADGSSAAAVPATTESIHAAGLAATVRFLSSDALEGRGPGSRGDQVGAALPLRRARRRSAWYPAWARRSPSATWEQSFPMIGIDSQAPPAWEFRAPGGRISLARREEFIAASGVQAATAAIAGRRGGLRRLRHPGAGVRLGRLQGRRPQGQGPADAQQRSGLGRRALRRQAAALLRPLDLQVRERRAPGRRRRHHHPHHAFGRLPVPGRAVLLDERTVRAPGRRRAAPPDLRLDDRGRRREARRARRPEARRRWSRPRSRSRSGRCRSACARASRSRTGSAQVETANVAGLLPGSRSRPPRRGGGLHRAPRPSGRGHGRQGGRHDLQRRARQRHRLRPAARPGEGVRRAAGARRGARSSSSSSPPRSRACSAPGTTRPTRPFAPGQAGRQHQPRLGEHLRPHARRHLRRPRQVVARRGGRPPPRRRRGGSSTATRRPRRAPSTARTSSTSRASACRRSTSTRGPSSSARAPRPPRRVRSAYDVDLLPPAVRRDDRGLGLGRA